MDDEPDVCHIAGRLLKHLGCGDAAFAENGEKAVEMYRAAMASGRPFDAVLLDLTVRGGMGGTEALARLKEADPAVRAIVCSGYAEDPVVTNYRAHGFNGVLVKPFTMEDLGRALSQVLNGGR